MAMRINSKALLDLRITYYYLIFIVNSSLALFKKCIILVTLLNVYLFGTWVVTTYTLKCNNQIYII